MYGFCIATLIGKSPEEIERKIVEYHEHPFFDVGLILEMVSKIICRVRSNK